MKTFLNPRWLLLINTIPILILALLLYGQYSIIESLLEEENRNWWKKMSAILGGIWLLNLSYTLFLIFKKRQVHALYGLLSLLVYIPFLYLYNYYFDDLLPFSIPSWMITENSILYAGTFIMPTLIYALFILVLRFTSENREHKVWVNLLISISIPLLTYLFTQMVLPLWQNVSSTYQNHIIYILIITLTLLFLFFLIRGIYVLMIKKSKAFGRFELFWKIPITIIFPVLGLLVNQGFLIGSYSPNSGIFGNFNSSWFIVLAIINGVSICMPNIEKNKYRILLFLFRSTTFSYTLYFFIVFLPFLPISIVAIILFGLGFLMLTPLILFPIHVNELSKDYQYLTRFYKKRMVAGLSILSFLIIPLGITFSYWKDKLVLNETLSYLYSPDYTKQYKIEVSSIEKTIQEINNRIRPGDIFFENGTPLFTSYYKWLVLDNLTLSDRKIKDIENIFLGKNENP